MEVSEDQTTLTVHFIHNLPGQEDQVPPLPASPLTPNSVIIRGGVRVKDMEVDSVESSGNILTIHVKKPGDFSLYTLYLVGSAIDNAPLEGFDHHLSEIEFSFKVNCQNEFDCKSTQVCPPEKLPEPSIDYLVKDYASFRRLILD
ncbi:MAG: putative baseplate assembly protein, partial [Gammaproteobacteria bacterium]|nr:putative baseplate assembly protein [Gammaproteobacteria bacterium]